MKNVVPKYICMHYEKCLKEASVSPNEVVIMLLGNKNDLSKTREVSTQEGQKYAQRKNMLFFETSALNGTNINEAFTSLANTVEIQLPICPPVMSIQQIHDHEDFHCKLLVNDDNKLLVQPLSESNVTPEKAKKNNSLFSKQTKVFLFGFVVVTTGVLLWKKRDSLFKFLFQR